MQVNLYRNEITSEDYNFIVSNIILSQESKFTYKDMLTKLKLMFNGTSNELESTLEKCLVRLREDGFLDVLGSNYEVVSMNTL